MNKLLTALATAMSLPVMALNLLGGIGAGIWLVFEGEWGLLLWGSVYMFFGTILLGLLLLPGLVFVTPAEAALRHKKYGGFVVLGALSALYTYALIVATGYIVMTNILAVASAPLWALLLWGYAVSTAPWQFMAAKEKDNQASVTSTFFMAFGMAFMIALIGFWNVPFITAFWVFAVFTAFSVVLQIMHGIGLARRAKRTGSLSDDD